LRNACDVAACKSASETQAHGFQKDRHVPGGRIVGWQFAIQKTIHLLGIVRRPKGVRGFTLLPHRWIVERTFGWLGRWRRLSKDYEALPATSEIVIYLAMIHLMRRRPAPPSTDFSHRLLRMYAPVSLPMPVTAPRSRFS
jgi:Transposase DDE domain